MVIRTRITQMAHERGLSAAEVARRLKLYRSNLSAMDAGKRSVSLKTLGRIAKFLGCSPGDLIEVMWDPQRPLFKNPSINRWLKERDWGTPDGSQKEWVHGALLAWQRHYRSIRK